MIVGIDEADVRACQTRNTPSPGLRFLARGVQTRKGRRSAATLARVNTARNYELLRFVEGTGHGVRLRPRDVKPSDWKAVGDIDKRPENSHTRFEHDIQAKVLHLHDRSDRVTAPHSFPVWLNAMGSDFWDPLDVAVFTTWVVGLQCFPVRR